MKFKVEDGATYYIKSKPSDYIIEALANHKGITVKEYIEWVKTTPGYSNLKKMWKAYDAK